MSDTTTKTYRLTQYSHGAGCGCKIAPSVLNEILDSQLDTGDHPDLLVGNDSRDDAAVYDMGNGNAIISTTDFFMPIVDDAFDFGRIASANAMSDVYAMGGTPLMAISILGWPLDKIPAEVARDVLDGSREACREAGIPLAGGHSIDSPEPIYGLAVTGRVPVNHLKRNSTAQPGDYLFLTKALGVGILSTAQKRDLILDEHAHLAPDQMKQLNRIGERLGPLEGVHAVTDVTGFGLLGHLGEMCQGSGVQAEIEYEAVPQLPHLDRYLELDSVPGGTIKNWRSYGSTIPGLPEGPRRLVLCDAQTSGGLLIAVDPNTVEDYQQISHELNLPEYTRQPIGKILEDGSLDDGLIRVV